MPMTTVEVDSNTANILQLLKAEADAQGISLSQILAPLAAPNVIPEKPLYETLPPAQLAEAFARWANSHSSGVGLTLEDVNPYS
jgi:hypothetical protein